MMSSPLRYVMLTILVSSLASAGFVHAQSAADETRATVEPAVEQKGPEDALNRGTPRGSIVGFLEACEDFDFDRAAQYLDLRNLPNDIAEVGGRELARQLKHVLSRAVWLDDYTVSDLPEGVKGDGLPDYRDELVRIPVRDGVAVLWMQHVPRNDGTLIWKLSNRSVALIPELYALYSYPPGVEAVRSWFPDGASFLGLELFKWFILSLLALVSWPLLYLAGILLTRLFSKPSNPLYPLIRRILTGPLVAVGILVVLSFALLELGLGARAQMIADTRTLSTIVVVWVLWSITTLYRNYRQKKLTEQGRPGAAKLMVPLTNLIKILVLLTAVLLWLNNVGINITTVLAGLGVGGLAVALALQKPLEDMMGAVTIFSQAPLRVGDLVRYGEVIGQVEDIGLRVTRIRTLTNSVVTVPNALIAHQEVENLSYRTKIRYWPTLRLRYDTTAAQLKEITGNIVSMLQAHERVYDDPIRARVTDFDTDAILVKLHSFMKTTDFAESLEIQEELHLRVMEIVQAAGARFALPGRSIHLEGGGPLTAP
jgi:MscS family membrane protein